MELFHIYISENKTILELFYITIVVITLVLEAIKHQQLFVNIPTSGEVISKS